MTCAMLARGLDARQAAAHLTLWHFEPLAIAEMRLQPIDSLPHARLGSGTQTISETRCEVTTKLDRRLMALRPRCEHGTIRNSGVATRVPVPTRWHHIGADRGILSLRRGGRLGGRAVLGPRPSLPWPKLMTTCNELRYVALQASVIESRRILTSKSEPRSPAKLLRRQGYRQQCFRPQTGRASDSVLRSVVSASGVTGLMRA